jgi:thiamine kinase-like enzyme
MSTSQLAECEKGFSPFDEVERPYSFEVREIDPATKARAKAERKKEWEEKWKGRFNVMPDRTPESWPEAFDEQGRLNALNSQHAGFANPHDPDSELDVELLKETVSRYSDLSQVKMFEVSGSKVRDPRDLGIDGIAGLDFSNFERVYMENNELTSPDGLEIFPNVEALYVAGNPFESFEGFERLSRLEFLSLRGVGKKAREEGRPYPNLKGLDRIPNLKSINFCEEDNLVDWTKVENALVGRRLDKNGVHSFYSFNGPRYMQNHYFKMTALDAVEDRRILSPESEEYKAAMAKGPEGYTNVLQRRAFLKYQTLMGAIGTHVPYALDFEDYEHIQESLIDIPSLNLTAKIQDTQTGKSKFVKFYRHKTDCENDINVQKLLARSSLVNDCNFVDLRDKDIESIISRFKIPRRIDTEGTCIDDKVTIATDGDGAKLGYGLVTEFIEGKNFEEELQEVEPYARSSIEDLFKDANKTILKLHKHANSELKEGDVERRDYRRRHAQLFSSPSSSTFTRAMDAIYSKLEEFMAKPEYVSFVHGDFHARNLMRSDKGKRKVFDFERSGIGLKVEDLVRLYEKAREYDTSQDEIKAKIAEMEAEVVKLEEDKGSQGSWKTYDIRRDIEILRKERLWDDSLSESVKEQFFEEAFGKNYNRGECEEMFSLVRAFYYVSAMHDYETKARTEPSNSEAWLKRKGKAADIIRDSLTPHVQKKNADAIIQYLCPEQRVANP